MTLEQWSPTSSSPRSLFNSECKPRATTPITSKKNIKTYEGLIYYFGISVKGSMYKHKYTQRKAVMQLYLFNAQYSHSYQFIFIASVQCTIFSFSLQQYVLQRSCYCSTMFLHIDFALNIAINRTISLYTSRPVCSNKYYTVRSHASYKSLLNKSPFFKTEEWIRSTEKLECFYFETHTNSTDTHLDSGERSFYLFILL